MIIKNFLNKIDINKYTLIILFLVFITGLIKEFMIVLYLVIIHEFGHYIFSYIFKYNIDKIILLPFGGYIKYNELIDKPLIYDFIITISGPIFQIIGYLLLKLFISDNYLLILNNYHYSMLIFNLLPIIPLDGSKLLNIILNLVTSYKLSYKILSIISFIILIIFIYFNYNKVSYYMIIIFLISELFIYIKNKNYSFNRFIFEKYLYINNFSKIKKVNNLDSFKRNRKHIIRINNFYYSEKNGIKKIKGV